MKPTRSNIAASCSNISKPSKLSGLKRFFSRNRGVTSPVESLENSENRIPLSIFSEPDLTMVGRSESIENSFNTLSQEFCLINTLSLHSVKSYGLSSSDDISNHPECQLKQFSHSGSVSSGSNHSLERSTSSDDDSVDFAPQLFKQSKPRKWLNPNVTSDLQKCLAAHRPLRDARGRAVRPTSSPTCVTPDEFVHPPTQDTHSNIEHIRNISSSQLVLSPAVERKDFSPHRKTPSILNLHKSFASALQIFQPSANKKNKSSEKKPAPLKRKDTTSLAEYCQQNELDLTTSDEAGFHVTSHSSATKQFLLTPVEKRSDFELEKERLRELAIADLNAHYKDHFEWKPCVLRSTSVWSTSGVTEPPPDPTEIQFVCEVCVSVWVGGCE